MPMIVVNLASTLLARILAPYHVLAGLPGAKEPYTKSPRVSDSCVCLLPGEFISGSDPGNRVIAEAAGRQPANRVRMLISLERLFVVGVPELSRPSSPPIARYSPSAEKRGTQMAPRWALRWFSHSCATSPTGVVCRGYRPTGPIQEVSISSGWAEAFLPLAARCDVVEAAYNLMVAEDAQFRLRLLGNVIKSLCPTCLPGPQEAAALRTRFATSTCPWMDSNRSGRRSLSPTHRC
jgi:hypothetical protein